METKDTTINMRTVPRGYIYCMNDTCPQHEECLRWMAARQIDPALTVAKTVLPAVLQLEACPHYRKAEVKHLAWGFDRLFAEVKSKDEGALREAMKDYLGGNGTYSRYKLGRRLLTPEQQEHIVQLFRQRGYTEELAFDHYADVFDFDH